MKCNVQAEVNRNHSTSPGTLSPQQLLFHVVPLYYYEPATSLLDDLKNEVHTKALREHTDVEKTHCSLNNANAVL